MKTHSITIEVPEYLINRFMNTYEKAHGVTVSADEIQSKLIEFLNGAIYRTITQWAKEHKTNS